MRYQTFIQNKNCLSQKYEVVKYLMLSKFCESQKCESIKFWPQQVLRLKSRKRLTIEILWYSKNTCGFLILIKKSNFQKFKVFQIFQHLIQSKFCGKWELLNIWYHRNFESQKLFKYFVITLRHEWEGTVSNRINVKINLSRKHFDHWSRITIWHLFGFKRFLITCAFRYWEKSFHTYQVYGFIKNFVRLNHFNYQTFDFLKNIKLKNVKFSVIWSYLNFVNIETSNFVRVGKI